MIIYVCLILQTFITQYRPISQPASSVWKEKAIKEDHVVTLTGLRAYSNYSIRVTAMKGSQLMTSSTVYVNVRDGVPHPPYNLTYTMKGGDNSTLKLSWKVEDKSPVEGPQFQIEVSSANNTYAVPTTQTRYNLKNVKLEMGLTIRVYAVNKVGPSQPAVLQFHTATERREGIPETIPVEKQQSPDVLICKYTRTTYR